MSSSLCLLSEDISFWAALWLLTQTPSLNPSCLKLIGTRQWPPASLNSISLSKPCSQASTKGSHTKPISSNLCRRSVDALSLALLWVLTQFPRLKPPSLKPKGTLQWPSASLNWSSLVKPSSQASAWGSQTKSISSSLCLRVRGMVSLACRCALTQFPSWKQSSLKPFGTRQWPSRSLKLSNNPNQNSQEAVLASTNIVLRADENSASTDTGRSKMILSLMLSRFWESSLAMSVRYRSNVSANSSSCALSALRTSHTGLKLLASMAVSWSSPFSMKTGRTIVPFFWTVAPRTFLMARPTAWMISTWLPRGSIKATPSSDVTSTPSAKHRALVRIPLS